MAKQGYVARLDIENAIAKELIAKGEEKPGAKAKARRYISDYKKEISKSIGSNLIINSGMKGREQYKQKELGQWLYNRRDELKEFRTPICPFKASFNFELIEGIDVDDGAMAIGHQELINPQELITRLLGESILEKKKNSRLEAKIKALLQKQKNTKNKRQAAGKAGGRGRQTWFSSIL